jgi:aerobic C4-dicarboxylate transport protein
MNPSTSAPAKTWYRQLWVLVLIAMLLGAVLGWRYPQAGTAAQPLGDAFIKAVRMLIAPLIFCTVVTGIAQIGNSAKVGRLAVKAIVYFEVLTTIALGLGLCLVNLLQPGHGMNVDLSRVNTSVLDPYLKQSASSGGVVPFLTNIIPNTFVGAFVDGFTLQVLFISVLTGFALNLLGDPGKPLAQLIDALSKMIFAVVGTVMWAAPVGAFGAIAFTVGKFGVGSLASLGKLVGDFYITCLIFVFAILGAVSLICGFNLLKLLRYLREEILVCIATTSSEVVLPRLISKMKQAGCDEAIVDLVVPAGYSFNLDGTCLYLATAAVFLAQATNTPLDFGQQVTLLLVLLVTSKGAAGVAGAAFVVLAGTLSAHQTIPVASVALILGIHRFMSQGLTPTNFIGNAVATIAISKWERTLDSARLTATLSSRS